MSNAHEFLYEIADILRDKGRAVEITETQESFGAFVWMHSIAPHWYDASITLNATKRNGRWSLGEMKIRRSLGKELVRTTRSDIRIAAEVYA